MNKLLWEETKKHIFIEFYYRFDKGTLIEQISRDNKNRIFESYGLTNGINSIAHQIYDFITDEKNANSDVLNFRLKQGGELIRRVQVILNDENITAFNMNDIKFSSANRFNPIVLTFPKNKVLNKTLKISDIAHELTHAIQAKKIAVVDNDTMVDRYENVMKSNTNLSQDTSYQPKSIKILQMLLYYVNNFERSAHIAEIKSELEDCTKHFNSIKEVCDFIYNTYAYKTYEQLMENCQLFYKVINNIERKSILKYINNNSQYNFNTYNAFLKWLNYILEKTKKKFNQIVPKMAYETLKLSAFTASKPNFVNLK